jgi:crotonobetainyl-CoA:carnitine CoA-transferase CaiB-like acyl-CoA transferase
MLLGDMGADVVKLEPPRGAREFGGGPAQANYFFLSVNRSKRSATLDLRAPAGREAFRRMAAQADVVVENFRPSVMPELGSAPAARAQSRLTTATSPDSAPPGRTRSAPASIRSRRACRA